MQTLKEMNKKLLNDKESTFDKLKSQIDQLSSCNNAESKEGLKTVQELERQVESLIKSIGRAEILIEEKEKTIGTLAI